MLSDGDGLHLLVNATGTKLWRLRFRFAGKANMLSLGSFPTVSLLDARKKRDEAKKQLANGINPSLNRKLEKAERRCRRTKHFSVQSQTNTWPILKSGIWRSKQSAKTASSSSTCALRCGNAL